MGVLCPSNTPHPPNKSINPPKKTPKKQNKSNGPVASKRGELNICLLGLLLTLCRELTASHSSFMENVIPGLSLSSLSSDRSAKSPEPCNAVSLTVIFPCSFPIVSDNDKCSFPHHLGTRPRITVE